MRIYAVSTLTSNWLCEKIFLPSIRKTEPSARVEVKKYALNCNENYASPGYVLTLLYRLKHILGWIEENMDRLILISDVDIMYLRPFILAMDREAAGFDITCQSHGPNSPILNFGQTLIRCSPATLSLFRSVYDECKRNDDLDQDVLNRQLVTSGLRYTTLSPLFANTNSGYLENMFSYHPINTAPLPHKNSIQQKIELFAKLHDYLAAKA